MSEQIFKLIQATSENGFFNKLTESWDLQLKEQGEDANIDFYKLRLDHAQEIIYERDKDAADVYGIFIIAEFDEDDEIIDYQGLVHVNHAHPKSPHPILRMVWHVFPPHATADENNGAFYSHMLTAMMFGGIRLAISDMKASEFKLYLQNKSDRDFAKNMCGFMNQEKPELNARIGGSWIHFDIK